MCGCKSSKCRLTVVAACDQATWLAGSSIWSPQQRPTQTNSLNRKTERPGRKSRVGVRVGVCGGGQVVVNGQGLCDKKGRGRLFPSFVPKSLLYPE